MTTLIKRLKRTEGPSLKRPLRALILCVLCLSCQDRSFYSDLKSPDPGTRIRAVEFLGSQRDRLAIPQLIETLGDSSVEVRAKAGWALGMLRAKEAAQPISLLLSDPEPRVRQSASRALLQIEEPDVLPSLKQALARESDEWVKQDLEDAIKHLTQFEGETDVGEAGFRGNWF
jgi:HEAT repeat protein